MGKLLQASKFAALALTSAGLERVSKGLGKSFLLDHLTDMPGLPAKAAQMLGARLGEARPTDALDRETFEAILKTEAPALFSAIDRVYDPGMRASIGQAHRARLKDGRDVCIKAQIPGVAKEIFEQLDLLLKFSEFSPMRRYGLDIADYRRFLQQKIGEELDYEREARNQEEARLAFLDQSSLAIPRVDTKLSTKTVLVQSFERSLPLREFAAKASHPTRLRAGEALARFVLQGIFCGKILHADLHPGNFGFREDGTLVIYDFGSTLKINPDHARALVGLVRSYAGGKSLSPIEAFAFLGFDSQKLEAIGSRLPAICSAMLEPLTAPRPFSAKDWDLAATFENVLGDDAWWFRSAGPAWFLYVIRIGAGLVNALKTLDVNLSLARLFEEISATVETEECLQIPALPLDKTINADTRSLAKVLRVLVFEKGREIVDLSMPARAVDELEDLLPESAIQIFPSGRKDLLQIKRNVQKSGYLPQVLFEKDNGSRRYRIWLE